MGRRPDSRAAPADFVVVGASHKTISAALRDRLFLEESEVPGVIADMCASGFDQALVMSTCDRVEILGAASDPDRASTAARALLMARLAGEGADGIYTLGGHDAVRHIFAIAASLESAVVGEAEVLGQLKAADAGARAQGALGRELDSLLRAAYSAAKDVRTNTAIAEGPVSLANAAVHAVRGLFGDLSRVSGLLVGPGDMGVLMLEQFRNAGLQRLTVAGANESRAQAVAGPYGAHFVTYDSLDAALAGADLVIGAAGTGREILTRDMIDGALRARRRKPVFVLDVAIPGDADPGIATLEDAFLYDLDDLEAVARTNRASRDKAAREAWDMIDRHVRAFDAAAAEREADPDVADLRSHFEAVRAEVLARAGNADNEEVTRRLVNRLLHDPTRALRDAARRSEGGFAAVARELFGLDSAHDISETGAGEASGRSEEDES
jgi:glutamyl-tRNA reductase